MWVYKQTLRRHLWITSDYIYRIASHLFVVISVTYESMNVLSTCFVYWQRGNTSSAPLVPSLNYKHCLEQTCEFHHTAIPLKGSFCWCWNSVNWNSCWCNPIAHFWMMSWCGWNVVRMTLQTGHSQIQHLHFCNYGEHIYAWKWCVTLCRYAQPKLAVLVSRFPMNTKYGVVKVVALTFNLSFGDRICTSRNGGMGKWVGVPAGCKQHSRVWAQLQKGLGWHWVAHFYTFWCKWLRNEPSHSISSI